MLLVLTHRDELGKKEMKKWIVSIALHLILLAVFLPCVAFADVDETLKKAQALYEQKDYLGSILILEAVKDKNAQAVYLIWKNEKEIGQRTDPPSRDESSPNFKYYQYAKTHPEYFEDNEAMGGEYTPTSKRYEEIKSLFPNSEYVGSIYFEFIDEYVYPTFSEGGLDGEGRFYLISTYQKFINQHPQDTYTSKAKERLEYLETRDFSDTAASLGFEKRFSIDSKAYKKYVREWLKSGPHREYAIEIFAGKNGKMQEGTLDRFNIPEHVKREIQRLLESGKMVIVSEAAFKNKDWQGPKFLVFDHKIK